MWTLKATRALSVKRPRSALGYVRGLINAATVPPPITPEELALLFSASNLPYPLPTLRAPSATVTVPPGALALPLVIVQGGGAGSTSPTPPIVSSGLVLFFDIGNPASYSGSGSVVIDISGNGNNGQLMNGVGYSEDNGGILTLDGINDYIKTGYTQDQLTNFTMSCTFRAYGTQLSGLMGFRSNNVNVNDKWQQSIIYITEADTEGSTTLGDGFRYSEYILSSAGVFTGFRSMNQNIPNLTSPVVTTGQWFTVTVTSGPEKSVFYVNGEKVGENISTPQPERFHPIPFLIGAAGNGQPPEYTGLFSNAQSNYRLKGDIASVLLYDRDLSAEEVKQNFDATKTRFGL